VCGAAAAAAAEEAARAPIMVFRKEPSEGGDKLRVPRGRVTGQLATDAFDVITVLKSHKSKRQVLGSDR